MNIKIKGFSEKNAHDICLWQYEGEYSVYNLPYWHKAVKLKLGFTIAKNRDIEFKSIYDGNEFIGYFRFIQEKDYLIFGIGLKPNCCGIGYSKIIMPIILKFAKERYELKSIKLEVRSFNKRAIKAYEKFGFKKVGTLYKKVFFKNEEFVIMKKDDFSLMKLE